MYAEVIPQIRTIPKINVFDYRIPDNINVKIGNIVYVDFRGKEVVALIYKIKKNSVYKKIKNIIKKNEDIDLSLEQVELIEWLAKKYNVSLCLAFKTVFPEIPKKKAKSVPQIFTEKKIFINKKRVLVVQNAVAATVRGVKPQLVLYTQSDEKNAYLSGLLNKYKQALIIVPEIQDALTLANIFKKYAPILIYSQLSKNQLWNAWCLIKNNNFKVIIGTKIAIFFPLDYINLIIIDNEENKFHANYDQNPKYHVLDIAMKFNEKRKIVLTSFAPLATSYQRFDKIDLLGPKNIVNVVDMNQEKEKGNYSYFSEKLLNDLTLAKNALLLFNRKDEAKLLVCKDCQEITQYSKTVFCPYCHSLTMKKISFGVAKLKKDLEKLFPGKKIIELTKEQNIVPENYDIIIGTEYALRILNLALIDYIGIISVDHQLAVPDYQASERVWQFIIKIANLRKRTILQTHSPANEVILNACQQNYHDFYAKELKLRKEFAYPPFDKNK